VTRRVALPTDEQVRAAMHELLDESTTTGKRATVVELARRVGLTNPTFWRHFPVIASELRHLTPAAPPPEPTHDNTHALKSENARLRRTNASLSEDLNVALASIQRLALENQALRTQLESAANVVEFPLRPDRSPTQ